MQKEKLVFFCIFSKSKLILKLVLLVVILNLQYNMNLRVFKFTTDVRKYTWNKRGQHPPTAEVRKMECWLTELPKSEQKIRSTFILSFIIIV